MWEQKVTCILIDGKSTINIIPKATMKRPKIAIKELTQSHQMIQDFNQEEQQTIGMILLELIIDKLSSNTLFHVINEKDLSIY